MKLHLNKIALTIIGLISFNSYAIDIQIEKKEEKIQVYYKAENINVFNKVESNLSKINKLNITKKESNRSVNFSSKTVNNVTTIYYKGEKKEFNQKSELERANSISDFIYYKIFGKKSFFNENLTFVKESENKYTLMVSDYEGANSKEVLISPEPIMSPDISPDGKFLVYVSFEKLRPAIFLQNIATKERKVISSFKGVNGYPKFSNDGKKILMSLSKDGDADLFVYDVSNSTLTKITNEKGNEISPEWISDTDFLFSSDKNGNPLTYHYSTKTMKLNKIFNSKKYTISPSYNSEHTIALYASNGFFGLVKKNNLTGKESDILKDFYIESPSLSKNGDVIVYATKENGRSILKFIDMDGNLMYSLRYHKADIIEPSF